MKGSDIKKLVIVKLEEKSAFLSDNSNGPILSGGDSLDELKPVYSYIDEHLDQAANEILLVAPLHRLNFKVYTNVDVVSLEDGVGRINLPKDFLRLHTLKMSEWKKPVHEVVTVSNPLYNYQQNKYTMGNRYKPVVTMSDTSFLKYYSVDESHSVEDFLYIAKFNAEGDYTQESAEAIAINCAKKIYEVYGNTEMVNIMQAELTAVLTNMQI